MIMNNTINNFLKSRGIPNFDIQDPTNVLLDIDAAEELLRLATQEYVPIIGAEVFDEYHTVHNTFDLSWSCECNASEDTSFKSYFDRSIEMAWNGIRKVRDRMKKTHTRLYINYCVPSDE